ncbi:MAG: dihydrofolate reductase family protein [Mariprofundaceae bacterium]
MSVSLLYPDHIESLPLEGLYLGLNLHRQADENDLLIYSNYIASVDGRISSYNSATDNYEVPESLGNKRDWRLYQELAAQSDVLITSGRYFRQLSAGNAQDMLPVGSSYPDLMRWRIEQGLTKQPAVAILSQSLDIPLEAIDQLQDRDIYLFTSAAAPADKRELLEAHGLKVVIAGEREVEGERLKEALINYGFRSAYMIAGPQVHRTLIAAGVLDEMFLTTRFMLLGSEGTHGLCEGGLSDSKEMLLQVLYMDGEGNQSFSHYQLNKKD